MTEKEMRYSISCFASIARRLGLTAWSDNIANYVQDYGDEVKAYIIDMAKLTGLKSERTKKNLHVGKVDIIELDARLTAMEEK